jgi:hypothetical protein
VNHVVPIVDHGEGRVDFLAFVLRRFLLRSLVLAGILLACFAHLIWNGWHAKKVFAENLPHPPLSSGKRDIDLWVPTYEPGRLYDLTFVRGEETGEALPAGARLKIQLASNGRTRLLVVRPGHPNTDVSWWALLTGLERLQIVADREWIDLGPAPQPGETLNVQVTGLLPGPFGFAQLFERKRPHFDRILIVRPESPRARPTRTTLRYKFEQIEPVPASETLARFFFFISCSRVQQVAGIAALAFLLAGWWWLFEKRYARAVACLIPAVTLLHVCCLAPFQGADEAIHAGTVEAVVWNPAMFENPNAYPSSLGLLYQAIGYDAWVRYPEIPVPIDSPERRVRMREVAARRLEAEAEGGPVLPEAFLVNPRIRAPLYYNAFRVAAPLLRKMSVLDRLEAYVVFSACASLLLFSLGLGVLSRAGLGEPVVLLYGLVALLPYSVGVVASCSNYSVAIGTGQLLAACLVAGVLGDRPRMRLEMAGLFSLVSLAGIAVWDDFVFLAVPALATLTVVAIRTALRLPSRVAQRLTALAVTVAGVLTTGGIVFGIATGRIQRVVSSLGARLPKTLGRFEDPSFWLLLAAAAAPLVFALGLALAVVRSRGDSESGRRRAARARSGALIGLFVTMFLVTPWTSVPFETVRLDYPDEVAAHWSAFWSNNFAFDQDVLSWKMYWGVFGYADVSYPEAIYAFARWACVGLFLALPVLSWRFTQRDPGRSALLLIAAGYLISVCVVTNSLRFFAPTNPWGRFILPLVPLAALPLLIRIEEPRRSLRPHAILVAVLLHLWTAIALLGTRYSVGT